MKLITGILRALAFLVFVPVFAITSYLWFSQDSLIYPAPDTVGVRLTEPDFRRVTIETSDGETLVAYWHPPEANEASIIVFHGNGDAAVFQTKKGGALEATGFGVLLAEYRGYGESSGVPSEEGLRLDALAAFDFAAEKTTGPVGLYAHSLGAAVAVKLATEREIFALVLESPFDSLEAVAQSRFPWLPVRLLLRHPFRSDKMIGQIEAPILIMHGSRDRVIPIAHGKRLTEFAPPDIQFVSVEGAGHNNLLRFGTLERAIRFFRNTAR